MKKNPSGELIRMWKLVHQVKICSTMVARWRRRNGYLQDFVAMEIEDLGDNSKFIEDHNGVSCVVCR